MAQADGVVANGTGSAVRSDINTQYAALWSNHSGSTEPSSGKVAYQFWADTNTSILKIRNSANNAWINLFTLAGGIDVDAASNFNEDVTFTGASANAVWDKSDNALEFGDNAKATFGAGVDLELKSNGTNGIIHSPTGHLRLQTTGSDKNIVLENASTGEYYAIFNANGAFQAYFDNSVKLATDANGVTITGQCAVTSHVAIPDANASGSGYGGKLVLGAGDDFQLFHNGTNNYIYATSPLWVQNNSIELQSQGGEKYFKATANGSSELYYDNDQKVYTSANGLQFDDNVIAAFGNSNDMQIWHSPGSGGINYFYSASMSVIHQFPVGQSWTLETTGADKRIVCPDNGDATSVRIYHNGSLKIETTSSGCTVTGTVTETSDIALKTNIEPLDNVLEKLKQITGYKYQFKDTGHNSMGVTAQDVEKVFPELVHGEEGEKTLQYSGLIGALVESVKELSAKVAALEPK